MSEQEKKVQRSGRGRLAGVVGLLAAGAVAGGVLASTLSASAADNSAGSTQAAAYGATAPAGPQNGPGGAKPVRSDETQLTGTDAEKVRAAALDAVSGGTVYRVETDAGDAAYEAHMTKSDGTLVTVKLDKNFKVTKVEEGMGAGDPAPSGANGSGAGG